MQEWRTFTVLYGCLLNNSYLKKKIKGYKRRNGHVLSLPKDKCAITNKHFQSKSESKGSRILKLLGNVQHGILYEEM